MVKLTAEEDSLLNGDAGEVRSLAMRHIVEVARFFDAERLVPVSQAHIMADTEALGEPGVQHLERLAQYDWDDRRVLIPTITDPRGADFKAYEKIRHDTRIVELEARARDAFIALGVLMTDTCINYQTILPPVKGEHLAFGDTGVCIYTNSVFGARTNYEGGPSALAAGLTGRTPAYGFHLDEHRRATQRIVIEETPDSYDAWGALGALIGERMRSYYDVPYIEGVTRAPDSDELKHFGAAMASYGSTAMFHIAELTPEAEDACDSKSVLPTTRLGKADIDAYQSRFRRDDPGLDVVVFAAPQLSLLELQKLAGLLDGRTVSSAVSLIATTNPEMKAAADRMGLTEKIENAGGILLEGVCFYQMHARDLAAANGWHRLMTNSAKLTNIIAGYGYEPIIDTMERCVDSAVAGKVMS
ncbi:MAG: aconitase X catalytic domain-containing protein [Pseudomonadota bacterium]